jgi:hypothetical protein
MKNSPGYFALIAITLGLLSAWSPTRAAAILIDGHFKDWDGVQALPIPVDETARPDDLGRIEAMKVTQDDDFLYVYLEFARPRPFAPGGRQQAFVPGAWDDLS